MTASPSVAYRCSSIASAAASLTRNSLFEAQVLTEAWRIGYNNHRPHSAHGWLSPVEFVERWVHGQQLQLA